MTFRVTQLVWSILWEEGEEGEGEEGERLVLRFCRDTSAYRIVRGINIIKNAIDSNDEFIHATIIT